MQIKPVQIANTISKKLIGRKTSENAKSVDSFLTSEFPREKKEMMINETCPNCGLAGMRFDSTAKKDHLCTNCFTRYEI
jgi:ssDNA-binding Zn-finger/Zn-ribbon topoisomerase 1